MTDEQLEKLSKSLMPHWREAFMQITPEHNRFRAQDVCGFDWTPQNTGAALTALARRGLLEKTKWTEDKDKSASYKLTNKGLLLHRYLKRNPL